MSITPSYVAPASTPGILTPVVTTDGGFWSVMVRGTLLTVVTLGIYRFWYRTNLRRMLWGRTLLDGSAFEYRGTAKELFIGFLIALAIMVPIYVAGFLISLALVGQGEALAGLIVAPIYLVLFQYAAYRSRRYRLSRTIWRGLAFRQTGSPWRYAGISVLWFIGTVLSAGLAWPWALTALEKIKVENSHYGSAQGSFSAKGGMLFLPWLWLWLAVVVPSALIAIHPIFLLLWLTVPLFYANWKAAVFRTFANNSRLGPISFWTQLHWGPLAKNIGKFAGLSFVLAFAVGLLVGGVAWATFDPARPGGVNQMALLAILVPAYLIGFIAGAVLKDYYMERGFWLATYGTLQVSGLDQLDQIRAAETDTDSAMGEGLADAADFGGI